MEVFPGPLPPDEDDAAWAELPTDPELPVVWPVQPGIDEPLARPYVPVYRPVRPRTPHVAEASIISRLNGSFAVLAFAVVLLAIALGVLSNVLINSNGQIQSPNDTPIQGAPAPISSASASPSAPSASPSASPSATTVPTATATPAPLKTATPAPTPTRTPLPPIEPTFFPTPTPSPVPTDSPTPPSNWFPPQPPPDGPPPSATPGASFYP